jgi:hypothetical protein
VTFDLEAAQEIAVAYLTPEARRARNPLDEYSEWEAAIKRIDDFGDFWVITYECRETVEARGLAGFFMGSLSIAKESGAITEVNRLPPTGAGRTGPLRDFLPGTDAAP